MNNLPKWQSKFIRYFCPIEMIEELEGDIIDDYNWRVTKKGRFKADLFLFLNTLSSLRFLTAKLFSLPSFNVIHNYAKVYFRSNKKQLPTYFFHIISLAVGLASFIATLSFYQFEYSYDTYHPEYENTYRLERIINDTNIEKRKNGCSLVLEQYLREYAPEIKNHTTLLNTRHSTHNIQYPAGTPKNNLTYLVSDSQFFNVFGIELTEGNDKTALSGKNSLIITEETRKNLFGDENGLGKAVLINGQEHIVSGVTENVPKNTHFYFDYLIHRDLYFSSGFWHQDELTTVWNEADFILYYFQLDESASISSVESKLNRVYDEYANLGEITQKYSLKPISDIHFQGDTEWELDELGNKYFVDLINILGILILIFTAINFTIIGIAKITSRAKELSVRSIIGSTKSAVVYQVIIENIFTLLFSYFIAITLIVLLHRTVNSSLPIHIDMATVFSLGSLYIQGTTILCIAITSSFYPLYILFRSKALNALKDGVKVFGGKFNLLRSLIILQIFFSIGLTVATLHFNQQLNHLLNLDPGFEKDNVVYMKRIIRGLDAPSYESFKTDLLGIAGVNSVTNTGQLPMKWPAGNSYKLIEQGKEVGISSSRAWIGYDYFKTLDIEIVKGREFSPGFLSDSTAIIINEAAAKELGLKNPVGMQLKVFFRSGQVQVNMTVIGVVKDFNYRSLHTPTLPSYFILTPNAPLITLNLDSKSSVKIIESMKKSWAKFSPEEAFNINYLKDVVNSQYEEDKSYKNAIQMLSIIALLLASFGIFGVSSFAAKRREKEFGIKKTLGAKPYQLFTNNIMGYLSIVIIGFILSIVPSFLIIENWLETYAYHININYLNYGIALISVCLIIALVTFKSAYKLSHIDPIKVLRNE